MTAKISTLQVIRRITLGIVLVGLTIVTTVHQKNAAFPSIDAIDPFGGLETLMKFIAGGELIKKIEPGTVILFGGIVVLGIAISRFFCGWFCAFGALQGIFGWMGKKIFKRRFTLPGKLDDALRWVKYPVLVAIVFFTWKAGELVIRPYDPLAAYGHLSAGFPAIWTEFGVGFVILVASMILSMLYERAFCKYLCPLGALNALLGWIAARIPLFRIKRVESTCISCSKCDHACSMNVDVSKTQAVTSLECIACMECVSACPTKTNSLITTMNGKAIKLGALVLIGFGVYFGAAAVGQAFGMLRFVAPSLKANASAGTLKVEDIKGSTTYAAVADSFGIELERLYRELNIDMKKVPPDTMLKDTGKLSGIENFEADAVRVAVARIIGVAYSGEKSDLVPANPEPVSPVVAPAAAPPTAPPAKQTPVPAADAAKPAEESALVVPADFVLEGTMSINDIATALKASPAAVIAKLGLPADIPVDKSLRDMKDQYGYTMPGLKEKIMK